ncbi:Hsp33 family molecular chaperone HslO [Anaerospora sp.]|uniref:Hsp33 family molecular chaperone HslO n=1 Tax=Anaerospora sp. TaxID=1960278 RepID=UPI00289DA9F3|nr:Hsp33 family molecular chaperone HslO [Anaerospora sp.]
MQDHLLRATANGVRAFVAVTTNLTEEARQRHDCYPIAAAALGRTMTGAMLLAANLKTDESISIRIDGDGPLGAVVADAWADGRVRGYVEEPHTDLPLHNGKLDVGQAVGAGHINVTRFTGLKQPFTGSAELVSGEIAEDMTNYLYVSEQTPSTISLGVLVNPDLSVAAAGGLMVQALPGADDAALEQIENNLAALGPISQLIQQGMDGQAILQKIFAGMEVELNLYEPLELTFRCQCSRERVTTALISLGVEELTDILKDEQAELCCHFCAEKYQFNKEELEELIESIKQQDLQ